ncbi:hypothetical protein [Bacillus sp. FJAT-27245]|uniref:hypothetical protein n=1 Tax=Bacillus sp. FJAT-27245 TaxID=1684144 RepID=UPI0006A7C0D0|nr:hypothetical protein [Bacillus sp. FJAT-27245]
MYRLKKGNKEMILRFSHKAPRLEADREEICRMLLAGAIDIEKITKVGSSILFHERLGAVIIEAEQFPSLLLTVRAAIPKHAWFPDEKAVGK